MVAEPTPIRGRSSLLPHGLEPLQRYQGVAALAADLGRCAEQGWTIIDLDADGWADRDRLHADLADALDFPDHYGRNLDALADSLGDLAAGRLRVGPQEPGAVLVVRRLDQFLTQDPRTASTVVALLDGAGRKALRYGWPLAVFLQTEDPALEIPMPHPPTSASVPWNRSERHNGR